MKVTFDINSIISIIAYNFNILNKAKVNNLFDI